MFQLVSSKSVSKSIVVESIEVIGNINKFFVQYKRDASNADFDTFTEAGVPKVILNTFQLF